MLFFNSVVDVMTRRRAPTLDLRFVRPVQEAAFWAFRTQAIGKKTPGGAGTHTGHTDAHGQSVNE